MEFRPTGKHLAGATALGAGLVFFLVYAGFSQPGRYYYEGGYNSHDAAFVNANPKAPKHIDYSTQCIECHTTGFEPPSPPTCGTAECHTTLDPRREGRGYKPVAAKFHDVVRGMDCGSCHRIHEFREIEAVSRGRGFDHALFVPAWSRTFDCASCHAAFDEVADVSDVLRQVPAMARLTRDELDRAAEKWLSDAALKRIERRRLGLEAIPMQRVGVTLRAYDEKAMDDMRASGREVLLYFRSEDAARPGGVCRYMEDELFESGPVAEAAAAYPVFVVDWETTPGAWRAFEMFRAGSLARFAADGTVRRLHFFTSPLELLAFLRGDTAAK